MHGHVHGVSQQGNPYSQVALSRTSAAQEAAATRRKLLRAAGEMDAGELGSDAIELLGGWAGGGERQPAHARAQEQETAHEPPAPEAEVRLPNPNLAPQTSLISFYV